MIPFVKENLKKALPNNNLCEIASYCSQQFSAYSNFLGVVLAFAISCYRQLFAFLQKFTKMCDCSFHKEKLKKAIPNNNLCEIASYCSWQFSAYFNFLGVALTYSILLPCRNLPKCVIVPLIKEILKKSLLQSFTKLLSHPQIFSLFALVSPLPPGQCCSTTKSC